MSYPSVVPFSPPPLFPSPLVGDVVFYYRNDLQGEKASLRQIPAMVYAVDPADPYSISLQLTPAVLGTVTDVPHAPSPTAGCWQRRPQ